MIHQFTHQFSESRYWVNESEGRKAILGRNEDKGNLLNYQNYRLAHRSIAANTNERTMICSILPKNVFYGHSLNASKSIQNGKDLLYVTAVLNSFIFDFSLRQRVSQNLTMFYIYQLPIPRLTENDVEFQPIVERAAKLICTTPEFDDLAKEVGLESHENGVTDEAERQTLRAELDAIVAHLYGLTEDEFAYILTTFPLVSDAVKTETLEAFRTFAPHPDDKQILAQINEGENNFIEFKIASYWNADAKPIPKKDESMKENITQAVTAFLNSIDGGAILIGIRKDKKIVGLADDFTAANPQDNNSDGYERFLNAIIRSNCNLVNVNSVCEIGFHKLEGKDICRILVKSSPEPVYHKGDLIIRDGGGKRTLKAKEAVEYVEKRWK